MKKILVADDQPMILSAITRHLSKAGFEVIKAENGLRAINKFDDEKPDAVVTDLLMPQASGLDVITHVRTKNQETPILVLSTIGNDSVIVEAFRSGADDYVRKPFVPTDLVTRLKNLF
jgi:two-component system response regulator VicR